MARDFKPDAIIIMGSDDLISEDYFVKVSKKIDFSELAIHSLTDLYFLDLQQKVMQYWGNPPGESMGLGRVVPRVVLDHMDWSLWSPEIPRNSGLDGSCVRKLQSRNVSNVMYSMKDFEVDALDIKSGVNINSWDHFGVDRKLTANKMSSVLKRLSAADIFDYFSEDYWSSSFDL